MMRPYLGVEVRAGGKLEGAQAMDILCGEQHYACLRQLVRLLHAPAKLLM